MQKDFLLSSQKWKSIATSYVLYLEMREITLVLSDNLVTIGDILIGQIVSLIRIYYPNL
jgi:hypothetical protein